MKLDPAPGPQTVHRLEVTRRDLQTLLKKLDSPLGIPKLIDPENMIVISAVEDPLEIKE